MLELKKIPDREYFALKAVSASGLKQLDISPLHYQKFIEYGSGPANEPMRKGTLLHWLYLDEIEPESIILEPEERKNSKAYKEKISAIHGRYGENAEIFKKKDLDDCIKSRDQLNKYHAMRKLYSKDTKNGQSEVCIVGNWQGMPVKCKIDHINQNGNFLVDLKTTGDVDGTYWSFIRYKYDIQAAFYTMLYEELTGRKDIRFIFTFVDWTQPTRVKIVEMDPEFMQLAKEKVQDLLDKIKSFASTPVFEYRPTFETYQAPRSYK